MSKHNSLTALAMEKEFEANYERRYKPGAPFAAKFERQAADVLAVADPPEIGPGGEIVRVRTAVSSAGQAVVAENESTRWYIRDTLGEGASRIAEDASIRRTDLLLQPSFKCCGDGY